MAVAAITDKSGFARVAGAFQHLDYLTLAKFLIGAAMQLQKIDAVRFQTEQAAVNLFHHLARIPVVAILIVTTLSKQEVLVAAPGHRVADQFLATWVAFRGIDHVQAGVERAVEQPLGYWKRNALIADLGASKAKNRDIHAGFSESAFFHALDTYTQTYITL